MGWKISSQVGELDSYFQNHNFNMFFLKRGKSKAFQKHKRPQAFFRKFDENLKISEVLFSFRKSPNECKRRVDQAGALSLRGPKRDLHSEHAARV